MKIPVSLEKKLTILSLILVIVLAFGWRFLIFYKNDGFIYDEGYDFIQAQNSVYKLITGNYSDVFNHPFLHYLFFHFWTKLSQTEFFLRIPFMVFGVIGVWGMYLLGKEIFSKRIYGLLVAFLAANSTFLIHYSTHVRITQLFLTVEIFALLFYWKAIGRNKLVFWLFYVLFSILALYLEYFAVWLILILNLHFLLSFFRGIHFKNRAKNWLMANLIILICYLPWLLVVLKVIKFSLRAHEYLRFNSLFSILDKFLTGADGSFYLPFWSQNFPPGFSRLLVLLLVDYFLFFLLWKLFKFKKNKEEKKILILLLLFFLPLLIVRILTYFNLYLIHDRLLAVFIIGFILMMVYQVKSSIFKAEMFGNFFVIGVFLFINFVTFKHYLLVPFGETWREPALFLRTKLQSNDYLIGHQGASDWPMKYYLEYRYPSFLKEKEIFLVSYEELLRFTIFHNLKKGLSGHFWLFGPSWEIDYFDGGDFWAKFVKDAQYFGMKEKDFKLIEIKYINGLILYEGLYSKNQKL